MICKELNVEKPSDLPSVIYRDDAKPAQIASLAKLVSDAAAEGDEVAAEILERAGKDLGELAVAVIERLGMQQQAFLVACVGSVFNSGEHLLESFRRTVLGVAPGAEIGKPLYPPTIGAAKLARTLLDAE
jgi:N-acetylglucosamine kinase-like BadF-type ATPase